MAIGLSSSGSTKRTSDFLRKMQSSRTFYSSIQSLAQRGVDALAANTKVDTGETSASWSYEIEFQGDRVFVSWLNSNVVNGVPVVIMLQYGHGTGTGGWVQGYDFINPAIQPIMDAIADEIWKKVTSA